MIRFLAELALRNNTVINPTPVNSGTVEGVVITKHFNIYLLDIRERPQNTYWVDWGGYYDNYSDTDIELFYGQFLHKVSSVSDILNYPYTMYITQDRFVLFNLPRHPWFYPHYLVENNIVMPFLQTALNPQNPTDISLRGVKAPVRLQTPSVSVGLSDNISGVVLNQTFVLNFINNDGYFDDEVLWNLFNTPARLKKAVKENPAFEDFKTIRLGLVENSNTDFGEFSVTVADRFRSMDNPACDLVLPESYTDIIIDAGALNRNIPVVYGRVTVDLIKLDETRYIAAEKITGLHGVFDRDGNPIGHTVDFSTGIITVTEREPPRNDNDQRPEEERPFLTAQSADITGYTNNRIGGIIQDLVYRKNNIPLNNSFWNMGEIAAYTESSARVNFIVDSGTVRAAVQSVLKNDMAFFIQQNDGRFTVRKYGELYGMKKIDEWTVTRPPNKSWGAAQKNYFSSCVIKYARSGDSFTSYLYREREPDAISNYRRRVIREFETDITSESDAAGLARLLASRYLTMRQTVRVSVGFDTSEVELLDTVLIDLTVNKRKFSKASIYFVKEIDPAQDILTLEEIDVGG